MVYNYPELLVYHSFTCPRRDPTKLQLVKGTAHRNNKPFGTKIKVNTCTNFCVLVIFFTLDIIKSEMNFKLKVKINNSPYIWFSMGIDHGNPYIYTVRQQANYFILHGHGLSA